MVVGRAEKRVILGGASITDASSSTDEYGRPQVNISLDSEGAIKCPPSRRRTSAS